MAKFFRNFLDSMKFPEDDDNYEDYLSEQEEKDRKRSEKAPTTEQTYKTREVEKKDRVRESKRFFIIFYHSIMCS